MIQRIQTIYLLIGTILAGVFLVLPLFSQSVLKKAVDLKQFVAPDYLPLLVAGIVLILLQVAGILSFKNRAGQIKVIWGALITNIILVAILGFWYTQLNSELVGKLSLNFGAALPIISLVLNFMALLAVKKDDKLVKSLDRLR